MMKKWIVVILGAVAILFSAGAWSQSRLAGAYVGLDIGNADFGDDDDTAFKLFGGFQFHPNFGAEVGYGMLADKGGFELTTLEILAVGSYPLANQLSVLGKIGFARLDASPGEDENEFTFALGLQYDITPNLGAKLQWQRYSTDPDDIDLITIGVLWKF